ncbi:hypothetical protein RYA05_03175 [Pseudomonas syringae pv. actinidiae]|nr:hypothetical protein [Pseudomonas syringae pv. actinidiae]
MYFPDYASLIRGAQMRKFRQPTEGEPEDVYRAAFADFMTTVDPVESAEIRLGVGYGRAGPMEKLMAMGVFNR